MNVLITGATGLIGQEITRQCQEKGYVVHYLTTRQEAIKKEAQYKGFFWDPKENSIDVDCLEGVEVIIHLAGASISERWTEEYKEVILKSRTQTANLLYKTLNENKHSVRHYISASAIGGYPSSYHKIYNENFTEYNDGFLGKVVKEWEASARAFASLSIDVSIIRVGVVMAGEGGALGQLEKPIKYYVGAPLGSGKQWQSWIHIQDLAGIFVHILENNLYGIYNAVAPYPVTNATMTREVAKILHKPLWLPNVPSFALKLLLGEMAAIVLESQKVTSEKIEDTGYTFRYKQLHNALQEIYS